MMCPQFKAIETETDEKKITAAENKHALLHPMRIAEVTNYILQHFRQKTHRAFLALRALTLCSPSVASMPPKPTMNPSDTSRS
jgi:type I site-specific restriction-modification system R (restriction) subunit